MLLSEAKDILNRNGYALVESIVKGGFTKGEGGGEAYIGLSNEYSYKDARRYFLEAIYGTGYTDSELDEIWEYRLNSNRKKQFEKTYEQFEKYRNGGEVKLYRGLLLKAGREVDMDKAGICWSFNRGMPRRWVDRIWDEMVYRHILNSDELEDCEKYILTGVTDLSNCALPYSFWLAGRFERPEWEVRIKDETRMNIQGQKKVE